MELNSVFPQHQNIVIKGRTIFCEVSLCCVSSHAYLLRPTKGAENCTVGAAEKYNTTGNSLNKSHTRLFTFISSAPLLFGLALYIIAKSETVDISPFLFLGD